MALWLPAGKSVVLPAQKLCRARCALVDAQTELHFKGNLV